MKKQSLANNAIFQFIYQGLMLVIPLILAPYLTRTLQETALGNYTYANSIAYYFIIIANLGISKHGQRVISQASHDAVRLRREFWSLYTLHIIISGVAVLAYVIYTIVCVQNYHQIYYIQIFYVLSALFDVTWLFYGLENFKSVAIRNGVVKIVECALIFYFVQTPADIGKYTAICTGGILAGQLVMMPQAIKTVQPIRFGKEDMRRHIKPLLLFSIVTIAATLYTVFDKTLLGILSTQENVAFYEYSNRIINVPRAFIGVIGTVMFPRACRLAAQGDNAGQRKYINYSFLFTSCIGVGSIFGLAATADLLSSIYYGEAFGVCGDIMVALSPLIYIIGMGEIIRTQYMVPNGMDRQYMLSVTISACINIILSMILIPRIGVFGAVVGTVSAELYGLIYQIILSRRIIRLRDIISSTIPFIIIGVIMYVGIGVVTRYVNENISGLLIKIAVGTCIYFSLTIIYLYKWRKEMFSQFFSRFKIR